MSKLVTKQKKTNHEFLLTNVLDFVNNIILTKKLYFQYVIFY